MENTVVQLALAVITVMVPVVIAALFYYLKEAIGTEKLRRFAAELEAKQTLAKIALQFVEQAYKDLDGPAKYEKVVAWMSERARAAGINLTTDEIKGLIKAAIQEMGDSFQKEWQQLLID
ncbi:hypothetical protein MTAT_04520 [Moorella thermoacetica]|uniref:Phage holin protein (Holin_LLH) n=1 Tax=Neomoorella thermoacetica TaxID=1525 RepID=A0AAC9MVG6_NEOTH|nr:phage holin [Moorella thermoacetica]AOQ24749.1 Phage holin protein (Holin_LLH) [Moorella thermoacetica]TYL15713.1 hypothetical protein MTAT_04520 [Moorella thermoacetica]